MPTKIFETPEGKTEIRLIGRGPTPAAKTLRNPEHPPTPPGLIWPSSFAASYLPGRDGLPGVVGPGVFGVTALQLFFDLDVAAVPERLQVLSDLHGTARRRQQVDEDLDAPLCHRRRIGLAEHLLQLDGEHRNRAGRIVQGDAPATGNSQGRGGALVKKAPLSPG